MRSKLLTVPAERAMLQRIVDASGKLTLVDKLLPKLRNEGRRVLIFSQFKLVLNILARYLTGRGYPYERIDGGVHGNERQSAIDRFCDLSTDSFIFLCCRPRRVALNQSYRR